MADKSSNPLPSRVEKIAKDGHHNSRKRRGRSNSNTNSQTTDSSGSGPSNSSSSGSTDNVQQSWKKYFNSSGGSLTSSPGNSSELFNCHENKEIAAKAFSFVISSTRKGPIPLISNVAMLLHDRKRLEQCLHDQTLELLRLRQTYSKSSICSSQEDSKDQSIQTKILPKLQHSSTSTSPPASEVNFSCSSSQTEESDRENKYTSLKSGKNKLICQKDYKDDKGIKSPAILDVEAESFQPELLDKTDEIYKSYNIGDKDSIDVCNITTDGNADNKLFTPEIEIHQLRNDLDDAKKEIELLRSQLSEKGDQHHSLVHGHKISSLTVSPTPHETSLLERTTESGVSLRYKDVKKDSEDASRTHVSKHRIKETPINNSSLSSGFPNISRQTVSEKSYNTIRTLDENSHHDYPIKCPSPPLEAPPAGRGLRGMKCRCHVCMLYQNNPQLFNVQEQKSRECSNKKSRKMSQVFVGDRVVIKGQRAGVVKFVGYLEGRSYVYIGLQLDTPVGEHSGVFNSKRYFECPPRHGIFVPYKDMIYVLSRCATHKDVTHLNRRGSEARIVVRRPLTRSSSRPRIDVADIDPIR